ncbi:MAG: polysaccharide biosynthesis/export family protein [Flavobacteriales bacterium]|nr:polysaccharide biosynthesis/export family protein [Flavobacteriales bacterium]
MSRPMRSLAWLVVTGALLLTGCTINRDIMFKTPTNYEFKPYIDSAGNAAVLQSNDVIQFRLFANDGFKMIDIVSEGGAREANFMNRNIFTYTIESDGQVKLPLLGRVHITGRTIRTAEAMLEERFAVYYNRPYVQLNVVNRRVVVFPGGGGDAKVVNLENNNTTLLEVLARAGGLAKRGNARKVKLFRLNKDGTRGVHQFDLSDIEGLKHADIVMQGDDVLYVQPNPDIAREAIQASATIITHCSPASSWSSGSCAASATDPDDDRGGHHPAQRQLRELQAAHHELQQ